MALEAHVCPRCGAPLPVGAPGTVDHCRFCSAETIEARAPEPVPPVQRRSSPPPAPPSERHPRQRVYTDWQDTSPADPGRSGRITGVICLVIGGLAVVFAVGMAIVKSSERKAARAAPATATTTATRATAPAPAPPPLPPLALKDLPTANLASGWRRLDAPGMAGTYATFDPVKNLGWARAIATAWKADAYVYELHVSEATKDGTSNLLGTRERSGTPPWLQYWFASASCHGPAAGCGLTLQITGPPWTSGASEEPHVSIMATQGSSAGELRDPRCTLRQALAALDKAGCLPSGPTYDVGLADPKWTIGFLERSKGSIGVVSSITCAAAPK